MMYLLILGLMSTPVAEAASSLPDVDLLRGIRAARIAHLDGDHDRELETLKQSVEAFPDDMSVLYALLVHHRNHAVSEEDTRRLRESLLALIDDPEGTPPAMVLSWMITDQDADRDLLSRVVAHLERRARRPSPDARLLELLGYAYERLGDVEGETEALERLVAVEPTTYRRWRLVNRYRDAGRWQDAADFVGEWLEADAAANLRTTYIDLLSRVGRLDEVVEQVELLLEERQAKPQASVAKATHIGDASTAPLSGMWVVRNAAWNLRDGGKDEAAERLFRKVLELDPDDEEVRNALLYLYGSEEELRALQDEAAARWQEEEDPNALFEEGTQRLTAGDAESALELLKKAAPGLPHLEAAWYNLGMAAYRVEDWPTVAEAFGKAAELNGERSQSFFYRGLALEKLKRCAEAVPALEKALALDSDRKLAHYYLAACYSRLGKSEKARSHRALYDAAN